MARGRLYRLTLFERFLSVFTTVRPGEGASVRHLFVSGFLLTFCFYLLKPVREALLLTEGSAELAAYLDATVAVGLVFLVPLYRELYRNLAASEAKSRILRWVIAFFITNLLVFTPMGAAGLPIAVPFYLWLSVFSVMVVSQFWAFSADLFNTKSGQRLFVVIMVGSSIGAWAGAQSASVLADAVTLHELMLLAAALLLAPLLLSTQAENLVPQGSSGGVRPAAEPQEFGGFARLFAGFDVVFRSRYLLAAGLLLFLLNLISSLSKYSLRDFVQAASRQLPESAEVSASEYILRFYGEFNAWISLLALGLQLFVVGRLFRVLGVRGALLVLPVFLLFQFGLLAVLPLFTLLWLTMIGQEALSYSLQNTTNQSLFLPLEREEKYVGKTVIDTVFVRMGDCAAGLVVFTSVTFFALEPRGFFVLILVAAALMAALALRLRGSHRRLMRRRAPNEAPQLVAPLPDVYAPAGKLLMFGLAEDAFFDPDPGDTLDYSIRGAEADLPDWVRFDAHYHTITVRPPPGSEGTLRIAVTATDYEGHGATASFELRWGSGRVPRLSLPVRHGRADPAGAAGRSAPRPRGPETRG